MSRSQCRLVVIPDELPDFLAPLKLAENPTDFGVDWDFTPEHWGETESRSG